MLLRNLLIALGVISLLVGATLSAIWISQRGTSVAEAPEPVRGGTAALSASHAIPAGTLLRSEDFRWRNIEPREMRAGMLLRGQVQETEFIGAIARRDFAADEALVAGDLVKPEERQFLAAVLKPDTRAVSLALDASQSGSGLVQPGDRVDVILTQSFADVGDRDQRSVGETVVRNVRVIALDQSLRGGSQRTLLPSGPQVPKTVTFEVTEHEAETLLVAAQLGRLQLSLRPLAGTAMAPPAQSRTRPTWASDVSPALRELSRTAPQAEPGQNPQNPLESAVRRPPVVSQ